MSKWTALFALGLVACGSSGNPAVDAPAAPTSPADNACADGFTAMDGDTGCEPVHAASVCAPGTRSSLGSADCVPVGVTACPDGFIADSSGWGCAPVVPATACASGSGTIEHLGSTACAAISDCSAPLPAGPSVLLVDASLADAAVDATHFKTIGAAVAAAAPGATIAVEAGTYTDEITLAGHAVTIVGRCAEQTILAPSDATQSAFSVGKLDDLTLSKMTLRGHRVGVYMVGGVASLDSVAVEDGSFLGLAASGGAILTVKNSVVRGITLMNAQQSAGLYANDGATVTVTGSVLSANQFMNVVVSDAATSVTLSRTIVRDSKPYNAQYGVGVYGTTGATITIDESAIVDNSAAGVNAYSIGMAPANVTLRRSVVRGTKLSTSQGVGDGVEAANSHIVIADSTIAENALDEINVESGSTLDISNSTLRGTPQADSADRGALGLVNNASTTKAQSIAIVNARTGAQVQGAGRLELDSSLIANTRASSVLYENGQYVGLGLMVETQASLALTKSTIEGAHTAGLLTVGQADVSDTIIQNTVGGLDGLGGRGLSVQNGGAATVARSAFLGNLEAGVIVMKEGASMTMTDSTVQGTAFDAQGQFGIGMLLGGDVLATVDHCTVTGSAGVGVMVAAAGGAIRSGTISSNAIGVNAQDGTTLVVGDQDPDARSFVVSEATQFVGNQTRVGSGEVPLPTPIMVATTAKK